MRVASDIGRCPQTCFGVPLTWRLQLQPFLRLGRAPDDAPNSRLPAELRSPSVPEEATGEPGASAWGGDDVRRRRRAHVATAS